MAHSIMSTNSKATPSPTDINLPASPLPPCARCEKRAELCLCADLGAPMRTRLKVLILQHPQEPDKELGSAKLSQLQLEGCRLNVGLSWPNLNLAWQGKSEVNSAQTLNPKDWACIYLGNAGNLKEKLDFRIQESIPAGGEELIFVDKKGAPLNDQGEARDGLQGVILLDGTWSQAKTLWWRNAWLLKCKRAALMPKSASLYGSLRKEPRKECLSTIESIALTLEALGESSEVSQTLRSSFRRLL